jgi:hypothetical protein
MRKKYLNNYRGTILFDGVLAAQQRKFGVGCAEGAPHHDL